MMLVPALIFAAALGVSVLTSARWLPRLAPDRVGRCAFAVTCCLVGFAGALVALDAYVTIRTIANATYVGGLGNRKADVLAAGLIEILRNAGPVLGLAAAVYLLGPAAEGVERAEPTSVRSPGAA